MGDKVWNPADWTVLLKLYRLGDRHGAAEEVRRCRGEHVVTAAQIAQVGFTEYGGAVSVAIRAESSEMVTTGGPAASLASTEKMLDADRMFVVGDVKEIVGVSGSEAYVTVLDAPTLLAGSTAPTEYRMPSGKHIRDGHSHRA